MDDLLQNRRKPKGAIYQAAKLYSLLPQGPMQLIVQEPWKLLMQKHRSFVVRSRIKSTSSLIMA
jgi:hypothetical protein